MPAHRALVEVVHEHGAKIQPQIVHAGPDGLGPEMFGVDSVETVIQTINAGPRPLAIYPFSNDRRQVQMLLDRVMSGGVSVIEALFHLAQHDLRHVAETQAERIGLPADEIESYLKGIRYRLGEEELKGAQLFEEKLKALG